VVQDRLRELIAKYENDRTQYESNAYNETEVRVDFINPLFEALGWDVNNVKNLPQHLREVKHEATVGVEVDGAIMNKKPDYSFRLGTENRFYLEAKKPSVDITSGNKSAFQLRRYGWNGNLKLSVLTNFRDLLVYDCTIRPKERDSWTVALVAHIHYSDYADKTNTLSELLSRDSVVNGIFDEVCMSLSTPVTREPFDEFFLNQIRGWRNELCGDLLDNNDIEDEESLNLFVQNLLNRILFLRVCEDRLLESYETLKAARSYSDLKKLFEYADEKYDSGLFNLIDDAKWDISDHVLLGIFSDLYYPNSPYEFSVVEPHVIGKIYTLFLLEYVAIIDNKTFMVVDKPEAIYEQGAVNTPKNIADCIVHESVSPILFDLNQDALLSVRIADICCGSGSFLISVFELLSDSLRDYLIRYRLEESLSQGLLIYAGYGEEYMLSFLLRRSILSGCIFGVDIDPQAVEVAKFGLLIKLLENTSRTEIDAYLAQSHNKVLPNLDFNIKNGNSLIDDNYFSFNQSGISDLDLLNKIKVFNWQEEFGGIQFDAIVGNPPYIRVQNMVQYSPEEYDYYKWDIDNYHAANIGTLDKYYLFLERGVSLLRPGGTLGYIVPHKFMTIQSGATTRKFLSDNALVRKIIHFGTNQVFESRSTYTCILVLLNSQQYDFGIGYVSDVGSYVSSQSLEVKTLPSERLTEEPWVFMSPRIEQALNESANRCKPLSKICEPFVGMQTSADDIFIIKPKRIDSEFAFVDSCGLEYMIEIGILKKCIKDAQIVKYRIVEPNAYLIFPYHKQDGKNVPIPEEEMTKRYPYALQYLSAHKSTLDRRNMPRTANNTWYAYGRSQSIQKFMSGDHLVWPVLSLDSNYVLDEECIAFTGGGNGPYYGLRLKDDVRVSLLYVQALLNHWLLEYIVKTTSSFFRGGYYSHSKQFIEKLPIYEIDFNDQNDVQSYDAIIRAVSRLMELNAECAICTPQRRTVAERAIRSQQKLLDMSIDSLYGVSREWVDYA